MLRFSFIMDNEPYSDIALVRTDRAITNGDMIFLPTCTLPNRPDQLSRIILGSCGLGTIQANRSDLIFPREIRVSFKIKIAILLPSNRVKFSIAR